MQLRDYWQVFSKRWWLIILVAAAATVGSIFWSKFIETPMYRATIRLDVSPSRYDYGLTMVIDSLLRQYSQQLQTDRLADAVSDRLKLDLSAERLKAKVKVSSIPEDYALEMQVDDPDPNRARDIAYTWADEFVREHQIRMAPIDPRDRIDVTIHDKPRPGDLNRPKTRQNAMAAGLLGLMVAVVIVFVLEFLDDTLKTAEDVERSLNLTTLGTIPTVVPTDDAKGTALRRGAGGSPSNPHLAT